LIQNTYNNIEVNDVKNKQIEIIVDALASDQLRDYIYETFYQPIKVIKDTIARGLKTMKEPIANENLQAIKTNFMRYEMTIDANLQNEEALLDELVSKSIEEVKYDLIVESQKKEMALADALLLILDESNVTCQVYDLLRQLLYKTEDRIDIIHQLKN
jgi:hypothetical protein